MSSDWDLAFFRMLILVVLAGVCFSETDLLMRLWLSLLNVRGATCADWVEAAALSSGSACPTGALQVILTVALVMVESLLRKSTV